MSDVASLFAALAGRYRIRRELGSGGMATVYLAEDLKHRRKVALKVLRPGDCRGAGQGATYSGPHWRMQMLHDEHGALNNRLP